MSSFTLRIFEISVPSSQTSKGYIWYLDGSLDFGSVLVTGELLLFGLSISVTRELLLSGSCVSATGDLVSSLLASGFRTGF